MNGETTQPTPEPRVSVVVPVRDALDTLPRCLAALGRQTRPPDEVVFVDNGSRDGSDRWIEAHREGAPFPVRLVREARPGASAARNRGVRATDGDWIAFTDADCEPEPGWVAVGLRSIGEEGPTALAGPAPGTLEGGPVARLMGLTTLSATTTGAAVVSDPGPTGTRGFASANLWLRRDAFDRLGGFDERIPIPGEDHDLCARHYRAGEQVRFEPTLRVRHIHDPRLGVMWRRVAAYGRAHGHLLRDHGSPGWHFDLPFFGRCHLAGPGRVWIDLAGADKKTLLLVLLAAAVPPLWVLGPLYLVWLAHGLRQRARALDTFIGWGEGVVLGALLVVKSAALTCGRLSASGRGAVLV